MIVKEEHLIEQQFTKYVEVGDQTGIARMFSTRTRCGIYLLVFANGEIYVGKTFDITSRFRQHRKNHPDIQHLYFKKTKRKELDSAETSTVSYFQKKGYTLRNISLVEIREQIRDFNLVVSPEDQQRWLRSELPWESLETERTDYPEHRHKYRKKFDELKKHPDYEYICAILQEYILFAIPFPRQTEFHFWSVSCLPDENTLARVNIHWQETLSLVRYFFEDQGQVLETIAIRLYTEKSTLLRTYAQADYESRFESLYFDPHRHPSGGDDQQCLSFLEREFADIIEHEDILHSAKQFNLRLMHKGSCKQSRFHCYDLADELLRTDNLE